MNKEKILLEYPLQNASISVLWRLIGTESGLSEWFSDNVIISGNNYTFKWKGHEQTATLLKIKEGELIRFQWDEDGGTNSYFQFEILKLNMSGHIALCITDFADPDDKEDSIMLWDKQIEDMRRVSGM